MWFFACQKICRCFTFGFYSIQFRIPSSFFSFIVITGCRPRHIITRWRQPQLHTHTTHIYNANAQSLHNATHPQSSLASCLSHFSCLLIKIDASNRRMCCVYALALRHTLIHFARWFGRCHHHHQHRRRSCERRMEAISRILSSSLFSAHYSRDFVRPALCVRCRGPTSIHNHRVAFEQPTFNMYVSILSSERINHPCNRKEWMTTTTSYGVRIAYELKMVTLFFRGFISANQPPRYFFLVG